MISEKICTKCKVSKPLEMFGVYKKSKDKHKEVCKECRKSEAKLYYKKKDKQAHTLQSIKNRASVLGIPFDLEYEDLNPPELCPVFNKPLTRIEPYSLDSKRFSVSVDRIIPKLGYVKGNIQLVSQLANVMKHDETPEEVLQFADWIYKAYETARPRY